MYPESIGKNLNYKLRELEIIIKQLDVNKPALIDVDLALEKTRELHDLLLKLETGKYPDRKKEHGDLQDKPVLPSDPEMVQTENVFEAEEIIPDRIRGLTESGREPGESRHSEEADNANQHGKPETGKEEAGSQTRQGKPQPGESFKKEDSGSMAQQGRTENGKREADNVNQQGIPETGDSFQKEDAESTKRQGQTEKKGTGDESSSRGAKTEQEKMKRKQKENTEIEIIADRYQTSQTYINQAMADKQKKDISSWSRSKPLADLKNSIGLNDKFLFIKELFNGKPDRYNQCINALNKSGSYEEALEYIRNNCPWEEDNETAGKLLELVKRRHQSV
jgi:hypothetical protein